MTISGDWRIAEQAKYAPSGSYGFTFIPVPKAGDPTSTWAGGWSMALIPNSKAKDQAIKFMKFIAGTEGQTTYTKESTHLPTLLARCTLALPAGWAGLAALGGAAVAVAASSVVAARRFGGVTGDVLGATAKLAETGALLAAVAVLA